MNTLHTEEENKQITPIAEDPSLETIALEATEGTNNNDELAKFLKKIPVTPLTEQTRARLQEAIAALAMLKEEVVAKINGALYKEESIKGKISSLKESGKVNIDELAYQKSEQSVTEYVELLTRMIAEVERDSAYYISLISHDHPQEIDVLKVDPDNFEEHIQKRVHVIKAYVKAAKRDLAISYSRYCYRFDAQIRQIAYVEQVLKQYSK